LFNSIFIGSRLPQHITRAVLFQIAEHKAAVQILPIGRNVHITRAVLFQIVEHKAAVQILPVTDWDNSRTFENSFPH